MSQQPGNESFFFIADLHSLTKLRNGDGRRLYTKEVAATWLALGLDTNRSTFWRQSRVSEHTELAWYLNCFTPVAMLENATSYKDNVAKYEENKRAGIGTAPINAGLFTYPVLQAADILLYDADIVPVGKDQRQHLEMTRDIAKSFNHYYRNATDDIFVVPEARIDERLMVIPGVDGAKMSKSYRNTINIFAPDNELYNDIKKIKSDSTPLEAPKNPDTDITFQLYSLLASNEDVAKMRRSYEAGGYGYGSAKKALYELIVTKYDTERKLFDYYIYKNPTELEDKLQAGEDKARAVANQTIQRVRNVLGFS